MAIGSSIFCYHHVTSYNAVNWDDDENIRSNPRVHNLNLENLSYHFKNQRYKSIALWSYSLQYQLHGDDFGKYHIVNLLLHIVNVVLLFYFIKFLTGKPLLSALSCFLFAIHPMFVEPVVWITGRKDLLYMFFFLLSLLIYNKFLNVKGCKKILFLMLSAGLVFLASMAKIQAFTIPFVFIAMDVYYKRKLTLELILEKISMLVLIPGFLYLFSAIFLTYLFLRLYKPVFTWANKMYHNHISTKRKRYSKMPLLFIIVIAAIITDIGINMLQNLPYDFALNIFVGIIKVIVVFVFFVVLINNIPGYNLRNRRVKRIIDTINMLPYYLNNNKKIVLVILTVGLLGFILSIDLFSERMSLFTLGENDPGYFDIYERLVLGAFSFVFYLKSFFVPGSFNPMHKYPTQHNAALYHEYQVYIYVSIMLVITIAFLVVRYWKRSKDILFWVMFFLIQISIVLHVIPIEGRVVVADRYAYAAYPGLIVAFLLLLERIQHLWKKPWLYMFVLPMLSIYFISNLVSRLPVWKNSYTFWLKAVEQNNNNAYAHDALGLAYLDIKNDPDSAYYHINKALSMDNTYTEFYVNKGRVLYALDSIKASVPFFDTAIKRNPKNPFPYNNRASAYLQQGYYKNALKDYMKAVKLQPHDTVFKTNLNKARRLYQKDKMIRTNIHTNKYSDEEKLHFINELAIRLLKFHHTHKAIAYLELGVELDETNENMLNNLAYAYSLVDNHAKAIEYYNQLIKYFPENSDYYYYKGNVLWNNQQYNLACVSWRTAQQLGSRKAEKNVSQYCE